MLKTRIKTAAVVLPALLVIIIWMPNSLFSAFIAVLAAWGLYEIGAMTKADGGSAWLIALGGGIPLLWLLARGRGGWLAPSLVLIAMIALTLRVGREGPGRLNRGVVLLGALGVGALFPFFALLRNSPHGRAYVIMMVALVVASDSGAYFVGRALGRIKLMPRVSPNKTVEGAIGGLLASVVAALLLRRLLMPGLWAGQTVVLGVGIAILAQIGDLANSAFKRIAGVKDSGWLFPGHGGLLDRTCSLVFPAAFTYHYLFRLLTPG